MAWINIGDVRFRNPLPRSGKERIFLQQKPQQDHNEDSQAKFDHLLLRGNVPSGCQWSTKVDENQGTNNIASLKRKNIKDDQQFWRYKETSCDVELDTTGMKKNILLLINHELSTLNDSKSKSITVIQHPLLLIEKYHIF